jgi:hypothetical protein
LQFFVRLDHIRKCFTQKGGIFVLEEYSKSVELNLFVKFSIIDFSDPKTRMVIQRKYKSAMVRDTSFSRLNYFIPLVILISFFCVLMSGGLDFALSAPCLVCARGPELRGHLIFFSFNYGINTLLFSFLLNYDLLLKSLSLFLREMISFLMRFQADQICYAVLCVFSYVAAGQEKKQASKGKQ